MKTLIQVTALCLLLSGCRTNQARSNALDGDIKRIVIVTGIDYPGHHWQQTAPALADVLEADERLDVTVVKDPGFLASPELRHYDAAVLHFMDWESPDPGGAARGGLQRFVRSGKGLTIVHFGCGAFQEWDEFVQIAGRIWDPELRAHDPHGTFTVAITDTKHPITRDMTSFVTTDELYTCLAGETPIHVLATARSNVDDLDYPIAFVLNYGKGRVFHCVLGHDVAAIENSGAAALFRRGAAWTAHLIP